MSLSLFNTASGEKEAFRPLDPAHVRLYVCGPTVYDYAHIGNARPVVVFDLLVRLLRRRYPKVTYVRNITDVDDKINAAARAAGEPIRAITERTARAFHEDMAGLGALPPDVEPRATEHIAQMIVLIERLIAGGHAYAPGDGHVLFDVPSWPEYGRFARRSTDELLAGARIDVAPYKRDPMDFVLWKPSDAETPGWDSPWGRGRPGWHIECSAMAKAYLGVTFDIHGGGLDLIFPHHQNEVAQSHCANGAPLARYWMHNGYVVVDGEKMSKSLGNFLVVHDLLAEFPGEALRLALLSAHYRQPLDFTREGVRQARRTLDRWYRAAGNAAAAAAVPAAVEAALEDDLNTPRAFADLHALADAALAGDAAAAGSLKAAAGLMGLLQQDADAWFRGGEAGGGPDAAAIEALIAERQAARKARDFARADAIRDELKAAGVLLEDTAGTTAWRRAAG